MVSKKVTYRGVRDGTFNQRLERLAVELSIQGYVRRMPGGKVELVAQGTKDIVNLYLGRIERTFGSLMDGFKYKPAFGKFQGFVNRH